MKTVEIESGATNASSSPSFESENKEQKEEAEKQRREAMSLRAVPTTDPSRNNKSAANPFFSSSWLSPRNITIFFVFLLITFVAFTLIGAKTRGQFLSLSCFLPPLAILLIFYFHQKNKKVLSSTVSIDSGLELRNKEREKKMKQREKEEEELEKQIQAIRDKQERRLNNGDDDDDDIELEEKKKNNNNEASEEETQHQEKEGEEKSQSEKEKQEAEEEIEKETAEEDEEEEKSTAELLADKIPYEHIVGRFVVAFIVLIPIMIGLTLITTNVILFIFGWILWNIDSEVAKKIAAVTFILVFVVAEELAKAMMILVFDKRSHFGGNSDFKPQYYLYFTGATALGLASAETYWCVRQLAWVRHHDLDAQVPVSEVLDFVAVLTLLFTPSHMLSSYYTGLAVAKVQVCEAHNRRAFQIHNTVGVPVAISILFRWLMFSSLFVVGGTVGHFFLGLACTIVSFVIFVIIVMRYQETMPTEYLRLTGKMHFGGFGVLPSSPKAARENPQIENTVVGQARKTEEEEEEKEKRKGKPPTASEAAEAAAGGGRQQEDLAEQREEFEVKASSSTQNNNNNNSNNNNNNDDNDSQESAVLEIIAPPSFSSQQQGEE